MITACAQFVSSDTGFIEENTRRNLEAARDVLEEAAKRNADLVVFPELFNTGYFPDLLSETPPGVLEMCFERTSELFEDAARSSGCTIAAGVTEAVRGEDGSYALYNAVRVFSPGSTISYRKICLFPRSREPELFRPGNALAVFKVGDFTVGVLICYEVRFPELSRLYIDHGCDLLVIPAAFPASRGRHWRTLTEARAIENQMYVAAADLAGTHGTVKFAGLSMIADPSGEILASAGEDGAALVTADLSKERLAETRAFLPCYRDRNTVRTLFAG